MNMLIFPPQQPSKVFSSPFAEKTETRTVRSHPQHPTAAGGAATIAHFNQVLDMSRGDVSSRGPHHPSPDSD